MNMDIKLKNFEKFNNFPFFIGKLAETEIGMHKHDCLNMIIITKGNALFDINDVCLEHKKGIVCVIGKGINHNHIGINDFEGYSILFDLSILGDTRKELEKQFGFSEMMLNTEVNNYIYKNTFILTENMQENIFAILDKLYDEFKTAKEPAHVLTLFLTLIKEVCRCYETKVGLKNPSMKLFFETGIMAYSFKENEKKLVAYMAKDAGLSIQHFRRLFYENNGFTPKEGIRKSKIIRAKMLLLENNYSITEIAMICGFSDSSHMSRIFKQSEGMTPKEWKNKHLQNN